MGGLRMKKANTACDTAEGSITSARNIKKKKQRNHFGCVLPDGLESYRSEALYLIIAIWCMKQNCWVHRRMVSAAFGIAERRASGFIARISRESTRITSDARKQKIDGSRVFRYEILVKRVNLSVEDKRRGRKAEIKPAAENAVSSSDRNAMFRWLLSRNNAAGKGDG